jgi:amicoumacin kinase
MITVPAPVLAALAQLYNLPPAALAHFSGGREESDGEIFVYPYQDRRRLLKVMALPEDQAELGLFRLEERLRFAHRAGEAGIRLAHPMLSPQGRLYELAHLEGRLWPAYSMEIAPGRTPGTEDLTPGLVRAWGRLTGRLHRLAAGLPFQRASIHPASGQAVLTWQEEWQDFADWSKDDQVLERWQDMRRRLEALPIERGSFGFLHNDLHQWNLLAEGETITLLDFDVANYHWFVNDIAIACQSILFDLSGGMHRPVHAREELVGFLRRFLSGYREEYSLPAEWLDHLDLFFAYRRILLFTVMHGWISSHPEKHAAWKGMILSDPPVLGRVSGEL